MSALPEKVGKYSIHGIAGRGTTGLVYVGHDPFIDSKVAIKVCDIDDGAGELSERIFRKMFFNEAHTAGSLDNPNILKVHDAGEEDGVPYIVMEYVSGQRTLKDHCLPESALPVRRVIEIGFKCARALDYAHRRGVIHRDIKPTNIMLNEDGDVKIGDFGIAQITQGDVTQVMGVIGSPLYMSPEQASEDELNNQTDIYSLGAVLFELIAGRPPFMPAALTRLIFQLMNEAPPKLHELRHDLPDKLSEVIDRALAKDRNVRYKTCLEFATDLARVAGQLQVSSGDPTYTSDDEKFSRLSALPFFGDFTESELWEVLRTCRWESARTGTSIVTEGQKDPSFFVIVSGTVDVEKGDRKIAQLSTGDCFGEMGYLTGNSRTATIRACEDVLLIHITATAIERASVTCQLRFNKVFLQTLIARLASTSDELARVTT